MIPSNELRVGITLNIFQFEKVGFHPVTIDKQRLIALLNGDETTYYPIPLTPEILEKCGCGIIEPEITFAWKFAPAGQVGIMHCEYLHQFQNLFLSLTGQELEIAL